MGDELSIAAGNATCTDPDTFDVASLGGTTFTFGLILAAALLGIGIGALFAWRAARGGAPACCCAA